MCPFPPQMGDKTLAQSAQMYHYQHRKQQMLSVGQSVLFYRFFIYSSSPPATSCDLITLFPSRSHKQEQNTREPEMTSDEEEVGGDFTVYECPGLAPVSYGVLAR